MISLDRQFIFVGKIELKFLLLTVERTLFFVIRRGQHLHPPEKHFEI
jgi:hypothetical protein